MPNASQKDRLPKPEAVQGLPPLRYPDDNVESEFEPGDFEQATYQPTEEDKKLITLVGDRFRAAADARRVHEGTFFESLAFYLGNQFVEWSPGKASLKSLRDPRNPYRVYDATNKIKPKVLKLLARATQSKPDASVAPLTQSETDVASAAQSRSLLSHFDRKFGSERQTRQIFKYSLTTTTAFIKGMWDASLDADVPVYDDMNNVVGSERAPVGDMVEEIIPFAEVYPDPKAREWEKATWLIHAKVRPLSYIQERYTNGNYVEGESSEGAAGLVETRLSSVVGDLQRDGTPTGKNAAIVKEMWEKPTAAYPEGRLVTVAGGILLRDDPWPLQHYKEFPFSWCEFESGLGSIWGLNAVSNLISPQRSYNRANSRIQQHVNTAWGKLLVPKGAEIGANAFDSARPNEVIYYQPGLGVPQHIEAPALPPFLMDVLRITDSDMQDISGIHDVSNGQAPPGVTAGNAIEMLQESDSSQMADAIGNLESFVVRRAELRLAIARQYYKEPRLISVQDVSQDGSTGAQMMEGMMPGSSSPAMPQPALPAPAPQMPPPGPQMPAPGSQMPPQGLPAPQGAQMPPAAPSALPGLPAPPSAATEAMTFQNFAAGRVVVMPSSASAKSPAARAQQIMQMFQAHMFDPQNLPSTLVFLDMMGLDRSDTLVDRLKSVLRFNVMQAQASQPPPPDPLAVQQAKNAAQQQAMQMATEQEQAMEAIKSHAQIEVETAKGQIAQALQNVKDQNALLIQQQKDQAALNLQHLQDNNALILQEHKVASPPAVSLAGKMGATATESAEKAAGLESDTAAEVDEANQAQQDAQASQQETTLATAKMKTKTPEPNKGT